MNVGRYNPYAKFKKHTLSLNDYLAIDRTILANERTILAYGRTALAQVIIGGSALKLFDSLFLSIVGAVFLIGAAVTMTIGWRHYRHTDQLLRAALLSQTGESEHPLEDEVKQAEEEDVNVENKADNDNKE